MRELIAKLKVRNALRQVDTYLSAKGDKMSFIGFPQRDVLYQFCIKIGKNDICEITERDVRNFLEEEYGRLSIRLQTWAKRSIRGMYRYYAVRLKNMRRLSVYQRDED